MIDARPTTRAWRLCSGCGAQATLDLAAGREGGIFLRCCDGCALRLSEQLRRLVEARHAKPYPGREAGEGFDLARDTTFGRLLDDPSSTR